MVEQLTASAVLRSLATSANADNLQLERRDCGRSCPSCRGLPAGATAVGWRTADTATDGDLALPTLRRGLAAVRGGCRVGVRAVAQVARQRLGAPSWCSLVDFWRARRSPAGDGRDDVSA